MSEAFQLTGIVRGRGRPKLGETTPKSELLRMIDALNVHMSKIGAKAHPFGMRVKLVHDDIEFPTVIDAKDAEAYLAWLRSGRLGRYGNFKMPPGGKEIRMHSVETEKAKMATALAEIRRLAYLACGNKDDRGVFIRNETMEKIGSIAGKALAGMRMGEE